MSKDYVKKAEERAGSAEYIVYQKKEAWTVGLWRQKYASSFSFLYIFLDVDKPVILLRCIRARLYTR